MKEREKHIIVVNGQAIEVTPYAQSIYMMGRTASKGISGCFYRKNDMELVVKKQI